MCDGGGVAERREGVCARESCMLAGDRRSADFAVLILGPDDSVDCSTDASKTNFNDKYTRTVSSRQYTHSTTINMSTCKYEYMY